MAWSRRYEDAVARCAHRVNPSFGVGGRHMFQDFDTCDQIPRACNGLGRPDRESRRDIGVGCIDCMLRDVDAICINAQPGKRLNEHPAGAPNVQCRARIGNRVDTLGNHREERTPVWTIPFVRLVNAPVSVVIGIAVVLGLSSHRCRLSARRTHLSVLSRESDVLNPMPIASTVEQCPQGGVARFLSAALMRSSVGDKGYGRPSAGAPNAPAISVGARSIKAVVASLHEG